MSKTSDTVSDDQSNDSEFSKTKSNPDLNGPRTKDKLESGLFGIVKLNDLNPASITDPPIDPNQTLVNVIRVFNAANNESRYLLIHEETTAREVVMIAVNEFGLSSQSSSLYSPHDKTSSLNWFLYEVSVVPESKTIKQKCLSEQTCRLADRASLSSRFYIKNNSHDSACPSRLESGDDSLANEILKESPANITISCLNATLLAVELTLADFDKFRSIEPQQFVYDTFFDYTERSANGQQSTNTGGYNSSSYDNASLKSSSSDGQDGDTIHMLNKTRIIPKSWMEDYRRFADISNKEMFWVVCEILNERNIARRVKIVKQFIRAADVCSQLRNFNSMFAIISGLGHSCINRLKRTFDKLKPKYRIQLEKMRTLFDPSRNMSNYRICLAQTPPPAIPFFPLIKKDLTFTKEGRSIYVREPNDLSDDDEENFAMGPKGTSGFSQDTIKRRSGTDLASTKSQSQLEELMSLKNTIKQPRSISYSNFNNNQRNSNSTTNDSDSILVNFAELRQFTERVRSVHHFSAVPYSNDLLTNSKDNQRNQAQIKKMHEECQMRKRIRHYISQTLDKALVPELGKTSSPAIDQVDSSSQSSHVARRGTASARSSDAGLDITYDERALYQRSLEIEPEWNSRIPHTSSNSQLSASSKPQNNQDHHTQAQPVANNSTTPLSNPTHMQVPALSSAFGPMMPPASVANPSPTLSKSSSLSSCSSYSTNIHHSMMNPAFHSQHLSQLQRLGPMSSSAAMALAGGQLMVGKFGTESNESLRKIVSLRENCDDNRSCQSNGSNNGLNKIGLDGAGRTKSAVASAASSLLVGPSTRILHPPKRL